MKFLQNLFAKKPPSEPPAKWRLTPDKDGTYRLEKWNTNVSLYLTEEVRIPNTESAELIIANLERETIYR